MKRNSIFPYVFLLCCSYLFVSCKKDFYVEGDIKKTVSGKELTVDQARSYFNQSVAGMHYKKRGSSRGDFFQQMSEKKKPLWDKAVITSTAKGVTVKVPIDFGEVKVNIGGTGVLSYTKLNYLMMYKDSSDQMHAEWVSLMPDKKWLLGDRSQYKGVIKVGSWDGALLKHFVFNPTSQEAAGSSKQGQSSSDKDMVAAASADKIIGVCFREMKGLFDPCVNKSNYDGHCDGCDVCMQWKCFTTTDMTPIDVEDPPFDPGTGGGGPSGGGSTPIYIYGSSSTEGGPYTPSNCNPDPNYTMPTTAPPAGMEWVMPCGQGPTEVPLPIPPAVLSPLEMLETHLEVTDVNQITYLNNHSDELAGLVNYLKNSTADNKVDFAKWALNYLLAHQSMTWTQFEQYYKYNRTSFNYDTGDDQSDYTSGGTDETAYPSFDQDNTTWTTIEPVIASTAFIGWGYPGVKENCMSYAKKQLKDAGYQISGYYESGQTFQCYKASSGVNLTAVKDGISYLKYALSNSIPVIVGVDDKTGSPNPGTDNTTDHFIVIVGMGEDTNGKYFRFYDNASGDVDQGTHVDNKLYYDETTGLITGTSQTDYATENNYTYTLTMIRKSKPL